MTTQDGSDYISNALDSTTQTSENPLRIRLCMEDARTEMHAQMIANWCCYFKSLEGKRIVGVKWEQGDKSYVRDLVIETD